MRLLLLSRYGKLGASSRVRYLQYLSYFNARGIEITVSPLFSDSYVKSLYEFGRRPVCETLVNYLRRLSALLKLHKFDLLIIEKEIFPYLPALIERLLPLIGMPYLVDYDDAWFHRYDQSPSMVVRTLLGKKIDSVMRHSTMVVAGNDYLAHRARQAAASKVRIIPTVVDTDRYRPAQHKADEMPIVGWIGSPETSHYLKPLLPVFEALKKITAVRFIAIGANSQYFVNTPVETWHWSEQVEVSLVQKFDIGIMPLEDSLWERGKCGYKLIQYMACGIPVVASPVGVNKAIVKPEKNGFLADTLESWEQVLLRLIQMSKFARQSIGNNGRQTVEKWYSLRVQASRFFDAVLEATS